jgi:transcriptional regulator of acetoin/glycerol metabolism
MEARQEGDAAMSKSKEPREVARKTRSQTDARAAAMMDREPVVALRLYGSHYEVPLAAHRDRFVVGAAPTCDLQVPSEFASAEHCEIVRTAAGLVVKNLSKNGTWLCGERQPEFSLRANTVFEVGKRKLVGVSAWSQIVRRGFQRWLGYGERFQPSVDDAVQAAARRTHVLIAGPVGSQADRVARAIHDAWLPVARPFVVVERVSGDRAMQRRILHPASHGTLVVPAERLPPDPAFILDACAEEAMNIRLVLVAPPSSDVTTSIIGASLRDGLIYVRVPSLRERADDLPVLIAGIAQEIAQQLGAADVSLAADLAALYTYAWPENLDELEEVLRYVIASRKHGKVKVAAEAIGAKRTTMSDKLARVGIKLRA